MPRYRFRSVLLHAGVLLRHLRRVHVQEPNEPALGHDRRYLQRSHDLLDRHGSVGRFLSRYVPAYGGLQDHVVHGGIGRPLQHQSPDQDRRLLRLVESSSDAGPARGRMASSRRVVSEECPPVGRRGTGDDEAQTSDLLDLRAPLDGLHGDDHAFYLPPIPKLLLQVLSRYRGRLPDPDTVSGLQEEDPDSRPSVQALLPPEEGIVTKALVQEGQMVERGQPLFSVMSPALNAEAQRSLTQRELHTKKSSGNRALANAGLAFQSESRRAAAQTALETAEYRQGFLLVRSPIAGRVLSPRPQDLESRYVRAGLTLVRVGDCRKMVAEVPISERLLDYLKIGAPVTAQIQTRPMQNYTGAVASTSPATMEQPPTATAGRDPVSPSATPDRFVALAVFENSDGALLPGAATRVKIRSAREGFASRAWSLFWRWLRSIIW